MAGLQGGNTNRGQTLCCHQHVHVAVLVLLVQVVELGKENQQLKVAATTVRRSRDLLGMQCVQLWQQRKQADMVRVDCAPLACRLLQLRRSCARFRTATWRQSRKTAGANTTRTNSCTAVQYSGEQLHGCVRWCTAASELEQAAIL